MYTAGLPQHRICLSVKLQVCITAVSSYGNQLWEPAHIERTYVLSCMYVHTGDYKHPSMSE